MDDPRKLAAVVPDEADAVGDDVVRVPGVGLFLINR